MLQNLTFLSFFLLPSAPSPLSPLSHSHVRHLPDARQRRAHARQRGLVAREPLDRRGVADRRGRPRHAARRRWRDGKGRAESSSTY